MKQATKVTRAKLVRQRMQNCQTLVDYSLRTGKILIERGERLGVLAQRFEHSDGAVQAFDKQAKQ